MTMSFHSLANKTNFHTKGFAPDLALKERLKATRKWPISVDLALFLQSFTSS